MFLNFDSKHCILEYNLKSCWSNLPFIHGWDSLMHCSNVPDARILNHYIDDTDIFHNCNHCVKSVNIWSYSDPYSVRMRENTDQNNSQYVNFSRSEWDSGVFLLLRSRFRLILKSTFFKKNLTVAFTKYKTDAENNTKEVKL